MEFCGSVENVRLPSVADCRSIHLSSQPLPDIELDVNRKGKPGLQTHTHEAEHRMHPVVLQEETLPWRDRQFWPLRLRVRLDGIASAEFHRRERTNRTFDNALFAGNLCGDFLLVQLAGVQITDGASGAKHLRPRGFF